MELKEGNTARTGEFGFLLDIEPRMIDFCRSKDAIDGPGFKEEYIEHRLRSKMRDRLWKIMRDGRSYQIKIEESMEEISGWYGLKEAHRIKAFVVLVHWRDSERGDYIRKDTFGSIHEHAVGYSINFAVDTPAYFQYGQVVIRTSDFEGAFAPLCSPTGRLLAWQRVA